MARDSSGKLIVPYPNTPSGLQSYLSNPQITLGTTGSQIGTGGITSKSLLGYNSDQRARERYWWPRLMASYNSEENEPFRWRTGDGKLLTMDDAPWVQRKRFWTKVEEDSKMHTYMAHMMHKYGSHSGFTRLQLLMNDPQRFVGEAINKANQLQLSIGQRVLLNSTAFHDAFSRVVVQQVIDLKRDEFFNALGVDSG